MNAYDEREIARQLAKIAIGIALSTRKAVMLADKVEKAYVHDSEAQFTVAYQGLLDTMLLARNTAYDVIEYAVNVERELYKAILESKP